MHLPWTPLEDFLIRSAGFPWDMLETLRSPAWATVLAEWVEAERRVSEIKAEFSPLFDRWVDILQDQGADRSSFKFWYRLPGWVHKQRSVPTEWLEQASSYQQESHLIPWIARWNQAVETLHAAQARAAGTGGSELRRLQAQLRDVVENPLVQEALLLSNPNMLEQALPTYRRAWESGSNQLRSLEYRLYLYLQRLSAKNETAAFFGPIHYGRFNLQCEEGLAYTQSQGLTSRRQAYLAHWAVMALVEAIAGSPSSLPVLVPVLVPEVCSEPGALVTATGQRIELPAEIAVLVAALDGQRTLAQVAAARGRPVREVHEQLAVLIDRRIATLTVPLPTASFNPLEDLAAWIDTAEGDWPDRGVWRQRITWLQRSLDELVSCELSEKHRKMTEMEAAFSSWAGKEPRQGQGQIYVDRLIVYEEAEGHLQQLTAGGELSARIAALLRPALSLSAHYSLLVREAHRQRAAQLLKELSPDGRPVPLVRFLKALEREEWDPHDDGTVSSWPRRLEEAARSHQEADGIIRLGEQDVAELTRDMPSHPVLVTSPDLLLCAPDPDALRAGDFRLVLGELHYGTQVTTNFLGFHPNPQEVVRNLMAHLREHGGGGQLCNLVYRRRQGKTFYLELAEYSLEFSGRSVRPRSQVIPVADVEVLCDPAGTPVLRSRSREMKLQLTFGDPRSPFAWVFGLPPVVSVPLRLGARTPRVEVAGAVYQRERWEMSTAVWLQNIPRQDRVEQWAHLLQAANQHGLPSRFFARVPEERKPIFADLHNPFAADAFVHLLRGREQVVLSEVLPEAQDVWLRHGDSRFACEWRMVWVAPPSGDWEG